jgi:hypothetical protein
MDGCCWIMWAQLHRKAHGVKPCYNNKSWYKKSVWTSLFKAGSVVNVPPHEVCKDMNCFACDDLEKTSDLFLANEEFFSYRILIRMLWSVMTLLRLSIGSDVTRWLTCTATPSPNIIQCYFTFTVIYMHVARFIGNVTHHTFSFSPIE